MTRLPWVEVPAWVLPVLAVDPLICTFLTVIHQLTSDLIPVSLQVSVGPSSSFGSRGDLEGLAGVRWRAAVTYPPAGLLS